MCKYLNKKHNIFHRTIYIFTCHIITNSKIHAQYTQTILIEETACNNKKLMTFIKKSVNDGYIHIQFKFAPRTYKAKL